MLAYLKRQIDEICTERALRTYGAALCGGSALAFLAWGRNTGPRLADVSAAICWPFFEDCFRYRLLTGDQLTALILAGGALSGLGALLFLSPRRCAPAWTALLGVNVLRTLILLQDYTLRLNQHYFLSFAVFLFLFLPGKRNLLRYYLVFVYFWAGILKLNAEWLSGAALYADPLWVPDSLIPAAAAYVVVLECVLVWGMLSRRSWLFWTTFFQLCLFHLVSFPVVGFYYPLLMYLLLSIFPLTFFIGRVDEPPSLIRSLARGREPLATYVFLLIFGGLQLIPKLMPGDEAITGEGRLFAIHMFDARAVCRGAIIGRYEEGTATIVEIPSIATPRMRCDPAVYFSIARRACWERRHDASFIDLNLLLESRRRTAEQLQTVVDIRGFCQQSPSYRMLQPNDWIRKEQLDPDRRELP